jgi:hypothetical protein
MLVVITLCIEHNENMLAVSFAAFVRALDVSSKRKGLGNVPHTSSVATRPICKTENPNYLNIIIT